MARRQAKVYNSKFDWGGFKLLGGMGILMAGVGMLLFWATYTAPVVAPTELYALTASQRVVRMIPPEINSRIAIGISALFIFFGVFLFINALYRGLRFMFFKR